MVSQKAAVAEPSVGFSLDDFAALLDKYDYKFSPGDVVVGTVFSLEPKGALIDIGAKTAAYLPIQEMSINRVDNPDEVLQSDETREFFILSDENEDGQLTLSIRRIEYMRAWERVRQLQQEDATVRSAVFATNRGGALVRIEGLRGFIPGSHISTRKPKEEIMGEELPLKFLEVDEDRNRLVLSHRRALVERKMNRLEVGEVVIGTVRGIKPYGAFIDIGGVSGLLHISEISHDHIDTPSSVFNVNDELKVMIIDLDSDRGRISLSTKQLEPEPGAMVKNPELVYEKAEEMAARYREQMEAQKRGITLPPPSQDPSGESATGESTIVEPPVPAGAKPASDADLEESLPAQLTTELTEVNGIGDDDNETAIPASDLVTTESPIEPQVSLDTTTVDSDAEEISDAVINTEPEADLQAETAEEYVAEPETTEPEAALETDAPAETVKEPVAETEAIAPETITSETITSETIEPKAVLEADVSAEAVEDVVTATETVDSEVASEADVQGDTVESEADSDVDAQPETVGE